MATTHGITPAALFAWMTMTHPIVPEIVLEEEELSNVVACILSLRGGNREPTKRRRMPEHATPPFVLNSKSR